MGEPCVDKDVVEGGIGGKSSGCKEFNNVAEEWLWSDDGEEETISKSSSTKPGFTLLMATFIALSFFKTVKTSLFLEMTG